MVKLIDRMYHYMNAVVMNLSVILRFDKTSLVWQHHENMVWILNARMLSETLMMTMLTRIRRLLRNLWNSESSSKLNRYKRDEGV